MHEDSPLWEAIELWGKLTGVGTPNADGSFVGTMQTWAIRDTYTALKEALEYDPTEITATLLFKMFVTDWLKQASTSMLDMIENPEACLAQITTAKKLLAIIDRPEIVQAREEFVANVLESLKVYGAAEREDIKALLAKPDAIAVLRRDALRSLEKLRVNQFLDGEPEAEDVKPIYVNSIHQFWNINSLLGQMTSTPSGVALNIIRDPFAYDTFFAFAIRNGANLFVLTDVPEHAHPLAGQMSRRPDRDMDRRMAKNWFPYELLNVAYTENGDLYFAQSENKGVIPFNEVGVPTKKIGEVGAAETIWIAMMLDLIVLKFWKKGYKAPALSYTGEMIRTENALLTRAAHLPVRTDLPVLGLKALTLDDVANAGADDKMGIGRQSDQRYKWLEERYRDRLSVESLNLLEAPGTRMKLKLDASSDGAITRTSGHELEKIVKPFFDTEKVAVRHTVALHTMSGTSFGSPEQLDGDRRFIARVNYAEQINRLAKVEFEDRKVEIEKWFAQRIHANRETIIGWAGLGEVWVTTTGERDGNGRAGLEVDRTVDGKDGSKRKVHNRRFIADIDLTVPSEKLDWMDMYERYAGKVSLGRWTNHQTCAVRDGVKASRVLVLYPNNAVDLAALCGVKFEELPDVLQHFDLRKGDYYGNPILDRVDPMLWKVSNPWNDMDFRVRVPLSLSGRAQLRKRPAPDLPAHLKRVYRLGKEYLTFSDSPPAPEGTS